MTKKLMVGKVAVGGGAPVSIQSMCNTKTDDVAATAAQIKQLAVVTSDYHIALAATVLQTACTYSAAMQGGREMTVVAGASCTTSTPAGGDLSTQAWGISILTGTKWGGVSATSAVRKEMDADTDDWEEDQPMDVETDEWYE